MKLNEILSYTVTPEFEQIIPSLYIDNIVDYLLENCNDFITGLVNNYGIDSEDEIRYMLNGIAGLSLAFYKYGLPDDLEAILHGEVL